MKKLNNALSIFGMMLVVLLSVNYVVLAASSSDSEQNQSGSSAEAVQEETAEALAAIKDYTLEQRDEMVEEANQLLAYLDQRIADLSEKIDEKSASANDAIKTQWRDTLQTLREQRIEISQWLGGLQYGSQEAWEEVKTGFTQAYQDLSDALQTEEAKMAEEPSA
ncbi:MAG: hypothetical protein V2J55_08405 [Candidatus Competibacteraceae bacterium]|jgi:hypothetical protein|nr:hypothetical protein [Candidatus Competibacteraceae bacterium]